MKALLLPFLTIGIQLFGWAQPTEYFFRFAEPDRAIVNTTLTKTISIDNIINDTIYAYANPGELEEFSKLGYKYELLPHPSYSGGKVINMATTVEQMASWDRYPTYEVYRAMMKRFEQTYPSLCKLDSIGTTKNNHQIYAIKISDNVRSDEAEPEVLYTSTMHGNETTGYILLLRLIDYLLANYETDNRIKGLVDSLEIYINPNANPDGTYRSGNSTVSGATRYNANNIDINRNFPDPRAGNHPEGDAWQAETLAMMEFAKSRNFTLAANFHGGVELANYPWDTWTSSQRTHADNDWYIHLSRQYATLAQGNSPAGYFTYLGGVTNGGDWYVVAGGRQDYMNWWHHCREITLEVSNSYTLSSDALPAYWNYNKEALLTYLGRANMGFQGIISDDAGNPVRAKIFIVDHDRDSSHVYSCAGNGFYARPIEPGTWMVEYSAPGHVTTQHPVTVADWDSKVTQNITLERIRYSLTFYITHNGNPLANAVITFNATEITTDSEGKALLSSVPYGKGYTYTIVLNGYETATGVVDVVKDTTIAIGLTLSSIHSNETNILFAAHPNPFSEEVTIHFHIEKPTNINLSIYTTDGKKLATLANKRLPAGYYEYKWDGRSSTRSRLPSGIYLIRLQTPEKKLTQLIRFNP